MTVHHNPPNTTDDDADITIVTELTVTREAGYSTEEYHRLLERLEIDEEQFIEMCEHADAADAEISLGPERLRTIRAEASKEHRD